MGNVGFEIEVRNCCLKKDNKTKLVDGYKLGSIYIDSVTKGKNIISVEVEGEKVLSQNPYLELVTNVFENTDQCIKSLKRVVRFQEDLSLDEKLSNVTLKKNRGNFSVVQVNFDFPFVELYSSTFASSFTKFQEIKNKIDAYTKLKDKNVSIKSYLSYWIYKAKFYCRHDVQFLMEDKMPRGYDFRGDKKVKGKNLGGEDCEIKTNFEFLIKASDVDLLEIIGQDNRSTIENIFIDSDIVKKIYYIASADEKTNTDVIDQMRKVNFLLIYQF